MAGPDETLQRLQRAGRQGAGDRLAFEVTPDARHPVLDADGRRYEGRRFRVQALLAGRPYGGPFGVDAAFAEPIIGEPEVVLGLDLLGFAGLRAPAFRVYPLQTHIAEKLHAYTLPRTRPNSRVKDLPDLALLAQVRRLDAGALRLALDCTFAHRGTHSLPTALPPPPPAWDVPYARMSARNRLPWKDLEAVTVAAASFIDPVLVGSGGCWLPDQWRWVNDHSRS